MNEEDHCPTHDPCWMAEGACAALCYRHDAGYPHNLLPCWVVCYKYPCENFPVQKRSNLLINEDHKFRKTFA